MTPIAVLVTGADGQLGRALCRALHGTTRVIAAPRAALDVTDADAVRRTLRTLRPDAIVNAAAFTAVDAAEDRRDEAWAVNAIAPGILAEEAARLDAVMVHYSTDYVFDGEARTPYTEDAPTNPLGVYGASKLAGERAVRDAAPRSLVIRTGWLFAAHGHGFLQSMLRRAADAEMRDTPVRVVDDRRGTPTSARWVAQATTHMVTHVCRSATFGAWGTYHVAASGEATWHAFAGAIFANLAARGGVVPPLQAIPSSAYPTRATRPAYSVLDTSRAARTFRVAPASWQSQLAETLDEQLGGAGAPDTEPLLAHRD
ncbi:dTDP-4-dehydrorhamnose reductase [Gemmatirosa kalamazoonensis]|uniref:dTDP-4-dehydrorhamnose reductase n=1 Tax=Gemmatirosa kalamazoonensis TaxID=861299 RepID=W0RNL6_9BACT|nr:dTDP-4-dehydrorhamnose reductase [Gemmatirosa kalamazoonensis]AHG91048.1 dTDP-4-dehydrorhamnose reductase [Gemmatirosa kalamazoonensis]